MIHLTVYDDDNNPFILDLIEAESIYLTKIFSNITDFAARGGFSRDFRIPVTKRNAQFFSNIWNPNETEFSFKRKINARITDDTIPVATGYVQVKKVYSKGDNWHEIEIVFFSMFPNLISAIGTKKISELTDLPNLNHEMIFDNVPEPFVSAIVKYGLTDRGQKWSENPTDWDAGGRPIASTQNPLYVGDLTPFVQVQYLFDQVFADAGFTYETDSMNNILKNYYIPFIVSKDILTTETPETAYFSLASDDGGTLSSGTGYNLTSISMVEYADNGGNVDANFVFTAPYASAYQFGVKVNIAMGDWDSFYTGYNTFTVFIRDVDTSEILWTAEGVENGNYTENYFTPTLTLAYGQRIEMMFTLIDKSYFNVDTNEWDEFVVHDLYYGTGFSLIATSSGIILQGGEFNAPKNAPDYAQVDLIRDIIKLHNLVLIPDENNPTHIVIETMESYLSSGASVDWTRKQDLEKDIVLYAPTDEQKKIFRWSYKAGNEYLSQLFVTAGKRIYGDYELYQTNNDFATGQDGIELQLSSTPLNEVANTNLPIPKFVDSQGAFVNAGARMLYVTELEPSIAVYNEVDEVGEFKSISHFSHSSTSIPDVASFDLNFAPETYLQNYLAHPVNNMWNLYWRRYYNELYSDESRIMESYFELSPSDFIAIQFSDVIFVKDSYWRLLEISDFNVGKKTSVKCKLAKIISIPEACGFTPYVSIASGQIMFTDGVDTNLAGSKSCCELYGYTWNQESEKCYAFGNNGRPSQISNESFVAVNKPIVRGTANIVESGNDITQVIGNRNIVKSSANGSLVLGDGAIVKEKGFHLSNANIAGKSQGGLLIFSGAGSYAASASKIEIKLNGVDRLNLDDGAMWLCELSVVMSQNASTKQSAIFAFHIYKDTTAAASAVTTITQVGSLNTLGASIDVISDTARHRLSIGMTGGSGYPYAVEITAVLKYTQIK
jgi:hypothetical protein